MGDEEWAKRMNNPARTCDEYTSGLAGARRRDYFRLLMTT
jgi:hypothetical protein